MRAVNLIPPEARTAGAGGPSVGAWGLLGGLALLVVAVALLVLTSNQAKDRRAEVATLKQRGTVAAARADALQPYVRFADLEESRVTTVKQLAASRFDWYQALSELSHVMGRHVWLTSLTGTVTPDVQLQGGSTDNSFRSALPNPAVELAGCATSNKQVVGLVSRLRAMKGVQRVTLSSATKPEAASAGTSGSAGGATSTGGAGDGCGSDAWPDFSLVVFYEPMPAGALGTGTGTGGATPASASTPGTSSTSPTSTSTTPSSTTPSSGSSTASPASTSGSTSP